ncbi:MAG: flippase-like domain-containing protein [Gemmatimonadetes bacterium]|nr:flippase-like domain-containing protein [Gemmatimonadota bacterium]
MTTTPESAGIERRSGTASWLRLGLQLLLTAVVTGFVLNRIGFTLDELTRVDAARWTPRALPLAGSVVALLAGYVVSAWLWARMVLEMGGPRLPLWTAVRVYMVANLGRYVPGKVVQIAGLAWLARAEGVAAGTAVGAAVVGQGMALLGAFVVGLGAFFGTQETYRAVGWWGLGLVTVIVAATSIPASARVLERLWRRLAGARSGAGESSGVSTSDPTETAAARPGFGLRWTLAYAANWGLYAVAFWLLFVGLEGWAPFLQVGPAFAAAYLVGYLVLFAPAGVGIRESALVAFLLPVLPREGALALAIGARLWITAVEVVPAAGLAWIQARHGGISEGSSPPSGPDSADPSSRSSNSASGPRS